MKRTVLLLALSLSILLVAQPGRSSEPDYSGWNQLLSKYYDPAHGMDYTHLKANDGGALQAVRRAFGQVNAATLTPKERLAYWINVYNVNVVATIVEHYPVA